MKITGIIAEYNPFHTGHAYHLKKARESSGCDYIVVVMSPDFVQRGEPAVFDKFTRARMALLGGADLVLELPVCYACGSAEYFAMGAVALLDGLGAADTLCFGCETPSRSLLLRSAQVLDQEPKEYTNTLREGLRLGLTYPQSRARAIAGYFASHSGDLPANSAGAAGLENDWSGFFSSPNNILGMEYCKAIRHLHASMAPLPIRRLGSGYHDPVLGGGYCSATALRKGLAGSERLDSLLPYVPAECQALFSSACGRPIMPDDLMPWLTRQLLIMTDFSGIFDVSPDLSDRILKLRYSLTGKSWAETVAAIKTRQITEARIRRVLLHIILDISQELADSCREDGPIFYARILGFRREAAPLLRRIKETSRLPLITKPSAAARSLKGPAARMLQMDFTASHLYRSLLTAKYGMPFCSEAETGPVILP